MFNQNNDEGKELRKFFTMLAVCHTVMVDKDPETK
jgi:hypothetical protein